MLEPLLDLVWPRYCLGCAERLAATAPLLLCPRCAARVAPVDLARACHGCLRPLPAASRARRCGPCLAATSAFERAIAAWRYEEPVPRLVGALKFGRVEGLARPLGAALLAAVRSAAIERVDLVAPVPLPWTRRVARGFNQAELLAREVARGLKVPCRGVLSRPAFARPQSRRDRRGRLALRRRDFRPVRAEAIAGRRILLVDDVLTTGATARAAAAALRAAGAGAVSVAVLAWTPPPGERRSGPFPEV